MKNLSIGKKLIVTFGIILVLYVCSILLSLIFGLESVSNSFSVFYKGPYQISYSAVNLQNSLQTIEKDLVSLIMDESKVYHAEYKQEMESAIAAINEDITFLQENLTLKENQDRVSKIIEIQSALVSARALLMQHVDNGLPDLAGAVYMEEYAPMAEEIRILSNELIDSTNTVGANYFSEAEAAKTSTMIIVIVFFLVSIFIAIALCIYIIRSITKPLSEIEAAAKSVAVGDLSVKVTYKSKDELGSLAKSIRTLIANLRVCVSDISRVLGLMSEGDMTVAVEQNYYLNDFVPIKESMEQIIKSFNDTLSQINNSSHQVAAGSEQMAASAQALSQGAAEQASSAEQLAASISEVSDGIKKNADGARQANVNMEETNLEIQQGNDQMKKLVTAMVEVAETSSEIQKIIKTIDDIAFQTNILSLNAAVEAARAGSAGRGFAVVADEVRNLASKSAMAAKDTTDLIQNTLAAINNGDKMVTETEKSLQQIAQKSTSVAKLVQEIAESSENQASSIEQINLGVNQISSVIQTNSATAEESAASSEELSAQAEMLQELVSQFKLKKEFSSAKKAESKEKYF